MTALLPDGPVAVPVLCFVGTELPRRHLETHGVHLVTLRGLGQFLTRRGLVLSPDRVVATVSQLDGALRTAGGSGRAESASDPA